MIMMVSMSVLAIVVIACHVLLMNASRALGNIRHGLDARKNGTVGVGLVLLIIVIHGLGLVLAMRLLEVRASHLTFTVTDCAIITHFQ